MITTIGGRLVGAAVCSCFFAMDEGIKVNKE
jgi:hypothetical protein